VQMIGHQKKQCDVPSQPGFIKSCGIQNCSGQWAICQCLLFFLAIKRNANVKQCAGFNPVRHSVMQTLGEAAVDHNEDSKLAYSRAARWNALSSTRWQKMRLCSLIFAPWATPLPSFSPAFAEGYGARQEKPIPLQLSEQTSNGRRGDSSTRGKKMNRRRERRATAGGELASFCREFPP